MTAYADTLRSTAFSGSDIAQLIEGVLVTSSTYSGDALGLSTTSGTFTSLGVAQISLVVPASAKVVIQGVASLSHSDATKYITLGISEDSTSTIVNQQSACLGLVNSTSGYALSLPTFYIGAPSTGTHTYRLLWATNAATAYCAKINFSGFVLRA